MAGDLHTHTTFSDGAIPIAKLPRMAAFAGMEWLAVTDHDTFAAYDYAVQNPIVAGVHLLPGVELTSRDLRNGRKVHFLCYAPDKTPELMGFFSRMGQERNRRQHEAMEKLLQLYPFLDAREIEEKTTDSGVLFKAHIMRTLREYGLCDEIYGELYHQLFGRGGPCATGESLRVGVEEILEMAHKANGVVILAHPSVYDSMELAKILIKTNRIDGVEVNHPGNSAADQVDLKNLAAEYGLIVTGGTDYHGMNEDRVCPIGSCYTSDVHMQRLLALVHTRHGQK